MGTLSTNTKWLFHYLWESILFMIACLFVTIPAIIRVLTKGMDSLRLNTDIFTFFSQIPLGLKVFNFIIGCVAPYSGSIEPNIIDLKYDTKTKNISSSISIEEYSWLKNPFNSLHAIALANLGELASGLCVTSALQIINGNEKKAYSGIKVRGLPTKIETSYLQKARGTITGDSQFSLDKINVVIEKLKAKSLTSVKEEMVYQTVMKNNKGLIVAEQHVTWIIEAYIPSLKKDN